jgi:unsaturated rhamnogalacturonyl hydrolase
MSEKAALPANADHGLTKRRDFMRNSLLWGTAVVVSQGTVARFSKGASSAKAMDDALIQKVAKAALAMQRYSWEQGILAQAFLDAGEHETVILMTKAALLNTTPDGRMAAIGGGAIDPAMGGEAYRHAGQLTSDPQIQQGAHNLLEFLLKRAPRASDGTLYHVFDSPQIWSDSFYCAPPFLAAAGQYDEAIRQIRGFQKRLWNSKDKLLSHIWDEGKREFKHKDYWGVGNGWAAAGMTRVAAALPPERKEDRAYVAGFLKDLLDGCLAHQRPDGLFHYVVDRPETFVETNLAQMLAFAICTGVTGGWLPELYLPAAKRMRAAARAKVDQHGLVQGVCGAPTFDHPGIAAEGQAFFIMMEVAARNAQGW